MEPEASPLPMPPTAQRDGGGGEVVGGDCHGTALRGTLRDGCGDWLRGKLRDGCGDWRQTISATLAK